MSAQQRWSEWLPQELPDLWDVFQKVVPKPDGDQQWKIDDWQPSAEGKSLAWSLYVEIRTRVLTQPLHFLSGDEATALDSLYHLFEIVRELEKKNGKESSVVASLANYVLNSDIRPITARWHKRKIEGKLRPEDLRREFRGSLAKLQSRLRGFQRLMLQLAGVSHDDGSTDELKKVSRVESIPLGASIVFNELLGYGESSNVSPALALEIIAAETREIQDRRDAVESHDSKGEFSLKPGTDAQLLRAANPGLTKAIDLSSGVGDGDVEHFRNDGSRYAPVEDVVGVAISGGGIRSATFALGVIQGLAQRGIFQQVDVVSTVSGGGYLGSFFSTYLNSTDGQCGPKAGQAPFSEEVAGESRAVRSLRNNSRYIQPSSFLRWLTTVGQVAYGIASNLVLLSLWVFIAVLVTKVCAHTQVVEVYHDAMATPPVHGPGSDWSLNDYSKGALILSGSMLFFLPTVQRIRKGMGLSFSEAGWYEIVTPFVFVMSGFIILLDFMPNFHSLYYQFMRWVGVTFLGATRGNVNTGDTGWSLTATFVTVSNGIGLLIARGNWLKELARSFPILGRGLFLLLWMCGPVLFLYTYFELCRVYIAPGEVFVAFGGYRFPADRFILMLAIGSFLYSMAVNVNFTSLHRFYRNRLADTYLLEHRTGNDPKSIKRMLLSELRRSKLTTAPYHLVNATLNLPSSDIDELRGRNSDFFLFSKHFCGSPVTGYAGTTKWEDADKHLDLGTAMAISGAAAAPQMGMGSIQGASFLLTLLNVRLAYWLRRPYGQEMGIRLRKILSGPGPYYLSKEALNWMSEQSTYHNLSDGGHLENLGVYELLRRRCRFIVAIDGEHDPELTFPSLRKLQRFAHVDMDVSIEINVERIEWNLPSLFQPSDQGEKLIEDKAAERRRAAPLIQRFSRGHFALGKIVYPRVNNQEVTGWMLYVKLSVTGNEPDYVQDYRRQHPDFPHQTTNDQIFEEDQFEAYRALGQHIAGDLFATEIIANCPQAKSSPNPNLEINDWFQGLATTMFSSCSNF